VPTIFDYLHSKFQLTYFKYASLKFLAQLIQKNIF